jgi:sugar fermentation stimulation protein A
MPASSSPSSEPAQHNAPASLAFGKLTPARFLRRENRFAAQIELHGNACRAHVPNSGRLAELLHPGASVYVRPAGHPARLTAYDIVLAQIGSVCVCIDARWPPALVTSAWRAGRLPRLTAYTAVRPEVVAGASRLDLKFTAPDRRPCWVETKCVTLLQDGIARFPDAPTERGRRHLAELRALAAAGDAAAVIFVIQRPDAVAFAPHDDMDPAFGLALREAISAGVTVLAYACQVTPAEIALSASIPLAL